MRTFYEEVYANVLAQGSSASYTQVFSQAFAGFDRIVYVLVTHASADVAFDVEIATDSSGTSPTSIVTAVTANTAGKIYTMEIAPGKLTEAKQYISPKVTRTAGSYTLLELRYRARHAGDFTQGTNYTSHTEAY